MQINYQETSKDLLTRIDVHEKYGARNIDQWTVEVLKPQPGHENFGCGLRRGQAMLFIQRFHQTQNRNYRRRFFQRIAGDGAREKCRAQRQHQVYVFGFQQAI